MHTDRIDHVLDRLEEQGLSQMLVCDPLSIWYLSGYYVEPYERFLALYLRRCSGKAEWSLFCNKLFPDASPFCENIVTFDDTQNPVPLVADACLHDAPLGVDKDLTARWLLPLMDAGAAMSQEEGPDGKGSTGTVRLRRAPLNCFDTDLNNCPDLFPVVAVLACFCPGKSHIAGVGRLRHKETDRSAAIVGMLTKMGVEVSVDDDVMTITGMSLSRRIATGNLLKGGDFASFGDHRMVMALKVASLGADSPVRIDDETCVSKSFPGFIELFERQIV